MDQHNNPPYIYSNINYAEKRNLYMYSTHNWEMFLEDYLDDRNKVLREIKCKTLEYLDHQDRADLDIQQCDSHTLIEHLIRVSPNHHQFSKGLMIFLRKFEIKGKILANYHDDTESELLPLDYIKLSYAVSKFLKYTYKTKYMNFFLKLNDKIIFMKSQWIKTKAEPYFFSSLSCEVELIRKLWEQVV